MEKSAWILAVPVACAVLGATSGCADNPTCNSPTCNQDVAINAEVRSRLDQHPGLSPGEIHVSTHNRVVSLYGLVDNEMERQEVQDVVANAKDVTAVVNLLGVNNK